MKKVLFSLILTFSFQISAQELVAAPLSLFPIELGKELKLSGESKTVKIKILTNNAASYDKVIPKSLKRSIEKDGLLLTLHKNYAPIDSLKPTSLHTENTFLIDYQEPILLALGNEFKTKYKDPTLENIERFVNLYIENKNSPDMIPASVVAIRKVGDCKGHSILTTAFSRLLKLPSRVVLGIVFNHSGEKIQAAGHAWSEVYVKGKWVHADAAQAMYKPRSFYLPLSQIKDESAAFQMGLGQNTLPPFEKIVVESAL